MRVVVDHDVCELNALCVATAPDVFSIGDDDRVAVVEPTADQEGLVIQAAAACPTGAIRLLD